MNSLSRWADKNGFKFTGGKTTCTLFSKLRGMRPALFLVLDGKQIPVKKEQTFLRILQYKKLSFIPHIKRLRIKCIKVINIIKVLSRQSYGTDKNCVLKIFNRLVRSWLDNRSVIYQSASKSAFKLFHPVYHQGVRLVTRGFRTSRITSVFVESYMCSLEIQRAYAALITQ